MGYKEKYSLLVLLLLSSMNFYDPTFLKIDQQVYKFIFYILVIFLFTPLVNSKSSRSSNSIIDRLLLFLSVCQLLSALSCCIYKGQDLLVSLIAMFQGFAYVCFFSLKRLNIDSYSIEKIIKVLAVTYICLFVINAVSGTSVFGTCDDGVERGMTRYRLKGIYWVILFFLYCINKLKVDPNNSSNIKWVIISSIAILLSLTRQVIFFSFCFGAILYLHNNTIKQKIKMLFLALFVGFFILPSISIVERLVEKSNQEIEAQESYDNIRLVALDYYAFEYPRNMVQVLFGVGVPAFGKSKYGNEQEYVGKELRLFREDLGWIGFYFNYGLVATVILLIVMVYSLFIPLRKEFVYLKYFIAAVLFLSLASAPIQINNQIIVIVTALYLMSLKEAKVNGC